MKYSEMVFVITERIMVTALGRDAEHSCAGARSGFSRGVPHDRYQVLAEDGEPVGLLVHTVPLLATGFEGRARLVNLLALAMRDLGRRSVAMSLSHRLYSFYLSLPNPRRQMMRYEVNDDARAPSVKEAAVRTAETTRPKMEMATALLGDALQIAELPQKPHVSFVSTSGNSGVGEALLCAANDLRTGRIELAIVVGVDSLLDEETLSWLESRRRLKTPLQAAGLQPGEGCGILVIEARPTGFGEDCRRQYAELIAVGLADDSCSLANSKVPIGEGIMKAFIEVSALAGSIASPLWLISDHNGEIARAAELGYLLVRLRMCSDAYAQPVVWLPASAFGETGAASGALSLAMVCTAFQRQYAPALDAVVFSSSDGLKRSAVLLSAPKFHFEHGRCA